MSTGATPLGGGSDFALLRYTSDGTRDLSFGTGGLTTTSIGPFFDGITDLALDASQKIVVVGQSEADFVIARYGPDGVIDPAFGGGDGIALGGSQPAQRVTCVRCNSCKVDPTLASPIGASS
jgi:hypothetical protein